MLCVQHIDVEVYYRYENHIVLLFNTLTFFPELNELAEVKFLGSVFTVHLEELNKDNSPEVKSRVVDIKDFFNNL